MRKAFTYAKDTVEKECKEVAGWEDIGMEITAFGGSTKSILARELPDLLPPDDLLPGGLT